MAILTKTLAKELQSQFIPGNSWSCSERIGIEGLNFRPTAEDEVFRCCAVVCNDAQTGDIYCGEIAELVAEAQKDGQRGYVGLCERHSQRLNSVAVALPK